MGDYQMWLQFSDGKAGIVDLSDDLWGEDLEALRDPAAFAELFTAMRPRHPRGNAAASTSRPRIFTQTRSVR